MQEMLVDKREPAQYKESEAVSKFWKHYIDRGKKPEKRSINRRWRRKAKKQCWEAG